jgi:DNA-binding FrmR family transcriptional regulator
MPNDKVRAEVLSRLHTVKGHVAGIERMVEEKAPCKNVLLQLSAVRSAVEKIGVYILENNAVECLMVNSAEPAEKEKVEQIVKDMLTFLR